MSYMPYPGDDEYCNAEWPYDYPYDAHAEYLRGKAEIHGLSHPNGTR